MKNINQRIKNLMQRSASSTHKHLRGRHDQRDHNRWPAGYVAQSYVPTGRRADLMSNRTSGQLGGGIQGVSQSNILASTINVLGTDFDMSPMNDEGYSDEARATINQLNTRYQKFNRVLDHRALEQVHQLMANLANDLTLNLSSTSEGDSILDFWDNRLDSLRKIILDYENEENRNAQILQEKRQAELEEKRKIEEELAKKQQENWEKVNDLWNELVSPNIPESASDENKDIINGLMNEIKNTISRENISPTSLIDEMLSRGEVQSNKSVVSFLDELKEKARDYEIAKLNYVSTQTIAQQMGLISEYYLPPTQYTRKDVYDESVLYPHAKSLVNNSDRFLYNELSGTTDTLMSQPVTDINGDKVASLDGFFDVFDQINDMLQEMNPSDSTQQISMFNESDVKMISDLLSFFGTGRDDFDKLEISALRTGTDEVRIYFTSDSVINGERITASRQIFIDPKSKTVKIDNKEFTARQSKGVGHAMVMKQIAAALEFSERFGFKVQMKTEALSRGQGWIGYHVWPKMGYMFEINYDIKDFLENQGFTSAELKNTATLFASQRKINFKGQTGTVYDFWPDIVNEMLVQNPEIRENGVSTPTDPNDLGLQMLLQYNLRKQQENSKQKSNDGFDDLGYSLSDIKIINKIWEEISLPFRF